jgi:hypothetical protein
VVPTSAEGLKMSWTECWGTLGSETAIPRLDSTLEAVGWGSQGSFSSFLSYLGFQEIPWPAVGQRPLTGLVLFYGDKDRERLGGLGLRRVLVKGSL